MLNDGKNMYLDIGAKTLSVTMWLFSPRHLTPV